MRHPLFMLLLATTLWAQLPPTAVRPIQREVLRIPTRPGVVQPCLLLTESASPKALALLFPGGVGSLNLAGRPLDQVLGSRGNFLVRSSEQLLSPELAIAILDCPSDWASGMEEGFRASDDHAADVKKVLATLRTRLGGVKVFLVGTSRGTVSAAYVAQTLGGEVDGVVLSSSVFAGNKRNTGLSLFRFEGLKMPLLFVHHAEDGCSVCPYSAAVRLGEKHTLITVRGSIEPESGPCEPLSNHGYFGREAQVTAAVRAWILGRPFEREIP